MLTEKERKGIEDDIRKLLKEADHDVGVRIEVDTFLLEPLVKKGFEKEKIMEALRVLRENGYFDFSPPHENEMDLRLTQQGMKEFCNATGMCEVKDKENPDGATVISRLVKTTTWILLLVIAVALVYIALES